MVRTLNSKANEKSVHGAIVEFIIEWGAEPLPAHLPPLKWREEVLGRVRKTASRSDHTDINFFAQLESAIDTDLQDADSAIAVQAADALIDAASYYENIGIPDRALTLALRSLDQGKTRDNLKVQRRAHSYVGAVYTRLSDFHNACVHMQHAYELARKIGEMTGIFATLANTVAVLESMGLLSAARTLALKVASNQPWGNEKFDALHLSNASNGMRICHLLKDFENACKFYNLANKAMQSCRGFASEITIAHYEAGRVTYLTAIGKTFEAEQIVNSVLSQIRRKRIRE